jgi:hypothetical protein
VISALNPRSGWQNKAWGASPRITMLNKGVGAREAGDSAAARFAGSIAYL